MAIEVCRPTCPADKSTVVVDALEQAGYIVNLKDGTVSYETRREHEGKVYKGKKTLKINKVLNGLLKHVEKRKDIDEEMSAARAKYYTERNKAVTDTPAADKVQDDFEKAHRDDAIHVVNRTVVEHIIFVEKITLSH